MCVHFISSYYYTCIICEDVHNKTIKKSGHNSPSQSKNLSFMLMILINENHCYFYRLRTIQNGRKQEWKNMRKKKIHLNLYLKKTFTTNISAEVRSQIHFAIKGNRYIF